jgi:hypothetical protein
LYERKPCYKAGFFILNKFEVQHPEEATREVKVKLIQKSGMALQTP